MASGGIRWKHGLGGLGRGRRYAEHRVLTLCEMERTARSGEAGVDGEVLDGAAARAEETGTVPANAGLPARSGGTGRKRRPRRSGKAPPASSGRRRSAAIGVARRRRHGGIQARLGLGFARGGDDAGEKQHAGGASYPRRRGEGGTGRGGHGDVRSWRQ